MSVIDKLPLNVTNYSCHTCGKWHKFGSKLFVAHWDDNFDAKGQYKHFKPKEVRK